MENKVAQVHGGGVAGAAGRGRNRREFLKAAAGGAAGAMAGLSIARSAHARGEQVIKIGMIGAGARCSGAAAESMHAGPFVKLAAMCDVFEDRVRAARERLKKMFPEQVLVDDDHCMHGFDVQQKVIEASDIVLIACASKFHPMYAEMAIKAGKHVFVEKPPAIDPAGCKRLAAVCQLAKEKGLSIVCGLHSRFYRGYQECMKRIHDGAIGQIVAAQAMFLRGPYQLVKRDPKLTETQYQFSNWYHFCWLSGDDVNQSLVHNMDRVAWALKEETPRWCFGLAGRSTSFGEVYGDMFDHHTVVYEYGSGARVYALCQTRDGCYHNYSDIIMGTKGVCYLGDCRITGETNWKFEGPHNNPYDDEQKALIDSVLQGKPIQTEYMINSTWTVIMGQIACYTGKAVEWEQVVKSDFQFGPPPDQSNFDTPPPVKPDKSDPDANYPLPIPGMTKLI